MKVEFDSTEKPETLRAVAAFALMLAGDIDVPSVRDEVTHHITPDAKAHSAGTYVPREMILPPNELPRSIVGKGNPGPHPLDAANVVPFPMAPPVPVVPTAQAQQPSAAATIPNAPIGGQTQWERIQAFHEPGLPPAQPYASPAFPSMPLSSPAATAAIAPQQATFAPPAAAAAGVASANPSGPVEYDSAGLPWDARIHNKGRTKKKDGTWKLQKGLDPIVAQTVVAELAAKRISAPATLPLPPNFEPRTMPPGPVLGALPLPLTDGPLQPDPMAEARAAYGRVVGMMPELSAPYAPQQSSSTYSNTGIAPGYSDVSAFPQVPLPSAMPYQYPMAGQTAGTLPLPPFPGSSSPAMVPPSTTAAPMSPTSQPGAIGSVSPALQPQLGPSSPYKALIDKLTAATQNKTLNPALVAPTVQRFGVPNMGMLGDPTYAGLLPAISQEFDRLIAGGAPSGP